ncbi:protein involved in polysaccharide export, contains SLBB domain of the beta-grasp fold [Spirosomataceae bacterium TFI 002]|nr:protein involved in polysaccharide export, contains SLBB domain of the beta-grasp fold [Spirosomataceae bacterium TFI 002]
MQPDFKDLKPSMQIKTYLKLFILLALCLFTFLTQGQTGVDVDKVSDAQVEQFLKEMESRGMSEQEIEAAARLNGYSSDDIAKIRLRIERIKSGGADKNPVINEQTRQQIGEVAKRTDVQVGDETEIGKKKAIFGNSLFQNKSLSFEPNLKLPTPKNYILNTDDELKIDISGFAYQHYDVKVSPEGTIRIESLSPIMVSGLSIEEAKEKITARLKTLFGGLRTGGLTLDLTLGNLRSIQINILGEIANPGTYKLSSFATPLNALYLSGGPSVNGSMRNIKVLRNNAEIATIDLYELLTKGKINNQITLQDQDVIFVPIADKKIELEGEVKREMVFELKANESLQDAINYAGGFTEQAYKKNLNVTRYTDTEKKVINTDGTELTNFLIKNGDKVNIGAVLERFENKVEILGAVFRPGSYPLDTKLKTIGNLIQAAEGLREDAFKNRVLIQRENENLDREIITLDLNTAKDYNFVLSREDIVIIKSISELREERSVSINGAIVQPGVYDYSINLSVNDLILLAGGLSDGAEVGNIEIARRIAVGDLESKNIEIISFATTKELSEKAEKLVLKPFDQIFIREIANYEKQRLVTISGEVMYPGTYALSKRDENISDLVERAGGVLGEANLEGAQFFKENRLVALDLKNVLNKKSNVGNLILQEGDRLVIPKKQDYVTISGQVLNPTTVAFDPSFTFNEYIAQAGGYSDSAFVRKAYVRYANGLTDRTRAFMGFKTRPKSARGMEIVVPQRQKYRWTPAERIAVSSAFVSIGAIMLTIIRITN